MSEEAKTYTLSELQHEIKESISEQFPFAVWIVAEINTLTRHKSGHCYMELVQKSKTSNSIIAQARATVWANKFSFISAYFESETDSELTAGMNVMLQVTITYHEVYGLSLNVIGINPTYTIGDMERAKKEIIARLINEGVFDMNKTQSFPAVVQNIAVISSSTAAGYGDFVNHLETNTYGYHINITLFEAAMQGEQTETSVLDALNRIGEEYENYDAVAIIRGGGSKNDLSWFDNYNIAYMVTQFPLPVISGIGHERDESIVDMVAHTRMKTPTAVANFIIDYNAQFEEQIDSTSSEIFDIAKEFLMSSEMYLNNMTMSIMKIRTLLSKHTERCHRIMSEIRTELNVRMKEEEMKLNIIGNKLETSPKRLISEQESHLNGIKELISRTTKHRIEKANEKLSFLEHRLTLNDPRTILKRGYSITRINGKVVTNDLETNDGDIMETLLYDGKVTSVVKK
ncbi:MAG: exodeoxyribonuclease VII large subunit [Bacteroidales bacterium]|nr:exodeoxyribonuclease VII large subunit [Bacteroidales bacterium]